MSQAMGATAATRGGLVDTPARKLARRVTTEAKAVTLKDAKRRTLRTLIHLLDVLDELGERSRTHPNAAAALHSVGVACGILGDKLIGIDARIAAQPERLSPEELEAHTLRIREIELEMRKRADVTSTKLKKGEAQVIDVSPELLEVLEPDE